MVHNNKVLTVSYGTFSCTLEGFEDSFGTMKAIAEYFRDLASDDRYFGAEPPQPDAEMLARIAQREVARQVEARTSSEGIHLRAATPAVASPAVRAPDEQVQDTAAPAVAPAPPPSASPSETTAVAADDSTETDTSFDDTISEVELFDEVLAAATGDNIEEVAEAEPITLEDSEVELFEDAEEASPADEGSPADGPADATVDMATIAAISAAVAHTEEPVEVSEVDIFEPEASEAEDTALDAPAARSSDPSEDTVPAVDSIAAKLQRIRAVVAQTPDAPADEFSEDEHAEAFVESVAAELSQEDDENDEILGATDADDDEISRVLDRLDLNGDLAAQSDDQDQISETASTPDGMDDEADSAQDAPVDPPQEDSIAADQEILFSTAEDEQTETVDEATPRKRRIVRLTRRAPQEDASAPNTQDPNTQDDVTSSLDGAVAEVEAEAQAPAAEIPRARIVKVKRAELERIVAAGGLQEVRDTPEEETSSAEPTAEPVIESTLDDDDEADLMRELAQVEAALLASTQSAEAPQAEEEAEEDIPPSSTVAPQDIAPAEKRPSSTSPDSDVSRLMAAAESKLDDPDNATSRETYSQLRAAVAAAEADRSAGGTVVSADEAEPYREDLANVVRPRRPESAGAKQPRSRASTSRPAPLKLVAEQRIDAFAKTPAQPVRPRRISVLEDDTAPQQVETTGTFAEYARELGAAELHELLEAAASYMSFVEGRDHFSRPQLMNKVRDMGTSDFNREDGLRSFGQLLRDGKIARAENGRFAVTKETGFRPATRAAG